MGAESFLTLQIADFAEGVGDRVAALLQSGAGITLTYDDEAGTLTIANTGLGGSTGSTDNRILRADGTGGATVQNSAVTIDDSGNISGLGTVGCGAITASGAVLLPNGSAAAPALAFSGDTDSGIYWHSANTINIGLGGLVRQQFQSDGSIQLSGSDPWVYTANWAIRSSGSGVILLRSGNGSTPATVNCGAIVSSALVTAGTYTVATLPSAAANAGALAQVTDSSVTTNGSAVAGSGSNRVVVFSNGSTWDVVVA